MCGLGNDVDSCFERVYKIPTVALIKFKILFRGGKLLSVSVSTAGSSEAEFNGGPICDSNERCRFGIVGGGLELEDVEG